MELKPASWLGGAAWRQPLPSAALTPDSVRAKLMRVVLLTTILALSVTGIAMLTHELYVYRTTWTSDISTEAAILALSAGPALALDDRVAAKQSVNSLAARRRVTAAAVYGMRGGLVASFVRPGQPAPPAVPPRDGVYSSGEDVELAQPIEHGGARLGTIYVRAHYDLEGRIRTYAGIFLLATVLSLAAAYFLSRRMQGGITAPLDAIAGVAHAIVNGSDYTLRAAKISDDEIGVVVDAFNKMLEEVQGRTRALNEADRRKDEFLATLAHELRNPLAPIRHAAKILQAAGVDERKRQWARDVIARQVQRMALLLDDLLDVSRITSGRLDLKMEPVDIESLVRTAVETARPLIDAKQHRLEVELPQNPVVLNVDPLRVSQSLSNLLTNAAKYTDPGGLIRLRVAATAAGITISVKDNGIGFEARALPEIFKMFSQVEPAAARSEGGLGIGLALVKGLIGLHGGEVTACSDGPGRGSEFTLRLPPSRILDSVEPPARAAGVALRPATRTPRRATVLVVDDNRDAADSLGLVLAHNGWDVAVAYCGDDALRLARQAQPRAVILDIGMPAMSGYDVARHLRAEFGAAPPLLVAVTGWGQSDDKARALAAGFDHHLTKPVDPDQLERLLAESTQRMAAR